MRPPSRSLFEVELSVRSAWQPGARTAHSHQWAFRGNTYNQSTERGDDDSDDDYNSAGRCRTQWQIERCERKVKLIPKRHRHSGSLTVCMSGWLTHWLSVRHGKVTACRNDNRRRHAAGMRVAQMHMHTHTHAHTQMLAASIVKDELSERKLLAQSNHWTVWMALLVRMFVCCCNRKCCISSQILS